MQGKRGGTQASWRSSAAALTSMVRRGSTVRVRQRASKKDLLNSSNRRPISIASAKWGAKLVMVAVQKKAEFDLGGMLRSELTLVASQGYPTEIFEVTPELVEHQDRFARLISHRVPFSEVEWGVRARPHPGGGGEGRRHLRRPAVDGRTRAGGPAAGRGRRQEPSSNRRAHLDLSWGRRPAPRCRPIWHACPARHEPSHLSTRPG
jgi:hypothetical protein